MSSQSESPCSAGGDSDCLLQRLKAIQERTTSSKQYLSNSYVSQFLTNNDPHPYLSEFSASVRPIQIISDEDLLSLDRIIHDLQNIVEGANQTRDDILTSSNHIKTLLHPVRSLPDDILLHIFEWCVLSERPYWDDYGSLDSSYEPWRLSHVCRRWRTLTLAFPRLWSDVHIPPPHSAFDKVQPREDAILSRLDLQLERSGNTLLVVTFGDIPRENCSYVLSGNMGGILPLLRSTTNRWESLFMTAHTQEDDNVFLGCTFQNLTHLEVMDCDTVVVDDFVFTAFRHTPKLVHLRTGCQIQVDINWNNLISYNPCSTSLAAHSSLPSLQQLTIGEPDNLRHDSLDFIDQLPSLSLPTLHTLRITLSHDYEDDNDVKLFDYLSMPRLENLQITYSLGGPAAYPNHRQWKHLRNLSLSFESALTLEDVQTVVASFAGASRVTSLHLADSWLVETTALLMNGIDDIFPCLESLTLDAKKVWDGLRHVQGIMESRLNVPAPKIRELRMNMDRVFPSWGGPPCVADEYWQTAWEETFKRLCSLGVKVISTADVTDF